MFKNDLFSIRHFRSDDFKLGLNFQFLIFDYVRSIVHSKIKNSIKNRKSSNPKYLTYFLADLLVSVLYISDLSIKNVISEISSCYMKYQFLYIEL
jgi:hypothetical protein